MSDTFAEQIIKNISPINESNDLEDIKKIVDDAGNLMSSGVGLKKHFGNRNVESLGMFPGFKIKSKGKTIAVLSNSNVDEPDLVSSNGKVAIGYL